MTRPKSILHLHSSFNLGGKEARAVQIMNAFGGQARHVESMVFRNMITNAAGARVTETPFVATDQGPNKDKITINWSQAAKGRAMLKIRMDNPN